MSITRPNAIRASLLAVTVALSLVFSTGGSASEAEWKKSYQLEANGKYAQAAAVIEALSIRGEAREFALIRLAWLSYLQANYNDSIRYYRTALEINPHSVSARVGITSPLLAQQRWREAALFAKQILEVSPWHYDAHVRLMIAEEGMRKWNTLAKHALAVNVRYPDDASVLVYLARAYAWLGNTARAKAAYERILRRIPGHIEATRYMRNN
ncbi:MAG: tetratricopeptide repeat protein [Magnetococcales bacterium]|nr:tetratricopeptide repeat protein [Magnetococcales bacterium]